MKYNTTERFNKTKNLHFEKNKETWGVPTVAQQVKNLTSIHEDVGLIPGLSQWVKGPNVAVSCGICLRLGLELVLLWPWLWPIGAAPV